MKAVIYFLILAVIYVLLYLKNASTPVPEGCKHLRDACHSCQDASCPASGVYEVKGGTQDA